MLLESAPSDTTGENWSILEDLFHHAWFRRMWTLQEVALNSRSALVYCGDQTIEWGSMTKAMTFMRRFGFDHGSVLVEAMASFRRLQILVNKWRSCWSMDGPSATDLRFESKMKTRPQLSTILTGARTRESRDPKDKVYGLYGICQFLDIYMPVPDYSKSVEEIFYLVTKTIIEREENLNVLYEAPGPNRNCDLPSWVPDWEHSWTRAIDAPVTVWDQFHAGGTHPVFKIEHDKKILKLRGKIMDTVSLAGECIPVSEKLSVFSALDLGQVPHAEAMNDGWRAWEIFCEWAKCVCQSYGADTSVIEDFFHTVTQHTPYFVPLSETRLNTFNKLYDALIATNEEARRQDREELKAIMNRVYFMKSIFGDGSDPALRKLYFEVWIATRGKCFFTTEDSRMGTGLGKISKGNVVAVIAGLKMPLILAPVEGNFRLVGHAYIHGIMNGEVWPADRNETRIINVV